LGKTPLFDKATVIHDRIAERAIGLSCFGAAATEFINPALLAMDANYASSLGVFGFLLATGRAGVASNLVKSIALRLLNK
jgi:hypothetical protein